MVRILADGDLVAADAELVESAERPCCLFSSVPTSAWQWANS
jgi:hypothetical protein